MGTLFDLLGAAGAVQGITRSNSQSSRNGYNDANYAAKTAERVGELWSGPQANGIGGIFQQFGNGLATVNALSGLAGGADRSVATTVKTHDAFWGAGEEPPRQGADQYQAYPGRSRSYSSYSSSSHGYGGGHSSGYSFSQQDNTPQIYPAQPNYSGQRQPDYGNTRSFGTGRYDGQQSHPQYPQGNQPQAYPQAAPEGLIFPKGFEERIIEIENKTHVISRMIPGEMRDGPVAAFGGVLAKAYQQHPEQRAVIQQFTNDITYGNDPMQSLAKLYQMNTPAQHNQGGAVTQPLPEAAPLGAPQPITHISNQPPAVAPAASPITASLTAEDMRIIDAMSVKDYTKAVQRIIGTTDDGVVGTDTIKKFKEKMGADADTNHDGKVNRYDLGDLPTQMFKQIAQSARSAGK